MNLITYCPNCWFYFFGNFEHTWCQKCSHVVDYISIDQETLEKIKLSSLKDVFENTSKEEWENNRNLGNKHQFTLSLEQIKYRKY